MTHKLPMMHLGIVGGGQLARMLASTCEQYQVNLTILDPELDSPAGQISNKQIQGSLHDADALKELCDYSDVVTFDLEDVGADILMTLSDAGVRIVPAPEVIRLIQNKYHQKQHYVNNDLPTARFKLISDYHNFEFVRSFGLPSVQKMNVGGYDGRGVHIIRSQEDWESRLKGSSFIEAFVEDSIELAVMVACTESGESVAYDPVEMVVDPTLYLLDYLIAPARIDKLIAKKAQQLAIKTARSFGSSGLFGIELFCSVNGELFINEVAPRAHNSGHHTIEACATSQFENQLRACLNLPLGDTTLRRKALTMNLVGEPGFFGRPVVEGLEAFSRLPEAYIHFYGKAECRPGRKMGHITLLASEYDELIARANRVKSMLRIRGELKI